MPPCATNVRPSAGSGAISAVGQIPSPRCKMSAVAHGGRMLIFGGYDGKQDFDDVYELVTPLLLDVTAPHHGRVW